jgi:uncharacterized protein
MQPSFKNWVSKHQLLSFFLLSYAITFGVTFASIWFLIPFQPFIWFLAIFSPTISASIISAGVGGMPAVRRLFQGFTRWKVEGKWYLGALFLFLFPLIVGLVYLALGNPAPGLRPGTTIAAMISQLIFTLFSGPLAEEAGWRGFALPRLQTKYNALVSSLILGVIWACWHIPFYFHPAADQRNIPFPIYLVLIVVITTLLTWLYNNTKGSLVITALAHFCFNMVGAFVTGTLGLMPMNFFFMTIGPGIALWFIVVIFYFGPKHLSRKPDNELPDWPEQISKNQTAVSV